jgi:hypothetical protein
MSSVMKVITTLAGALLVFAVGWMAIGFLARAVKEMFCVGYGC